MKDIQAIITKRAEDRLYNDITEFLRQFTNSPLFAPLKEVFVLYGEDKRASMNAFFWPSNQNPAYEIIHEKLHDKYVEQESAEFMQKVDQIKDDIDSLLNQ
jgi:hypothetical protein